MKVSKEDFSVGSLAEGRFSIELLWSVTTAERGEIVRVGTSANVVLVISVQLPHIKGHTGNIVYKLLQQDMLVCNTVQFRSKVHNPKLR